MVYNSFQHRKIRSGSLSNKMLLFIWQFNHMILTFYIILILRYTLWKITSTLDPSIANWKSRIPFAFRNSTLSSGYRSGHKYLHTKYANKQKEKSIKRKLQVTKPIGRIHKLTHMIERRPRVCKKAKLAVSGKPDRKTP